MELYKINKENSFLQEEIGYWGKSAYFIKDWFEKNNIINYSYKYNNFCVITKELLQKLLKDCENILCKYCLCEKLIPAKEYDEFYYWVIDYTKRKIENILKTTDFEKEKIIYVEHF